MVARTLVALLVALLGRVVDLSVSSVLATVGLLILGVPYALPCRTPCATTYPSSSTPDPRHAPRRPQPP